VHNVSFMSTYYECYQKLTYTLRCRYVHYTRPIDQSDTLVRVKRDVTVCSSKYASETFAAKKEALLCTVVNCRVSTHCHVVRVITMAVRLLLLLLLLVVLLALLLPAVTLLRPSVLMR
jgi:hypothetical protein